MTIQLALIGICVVFVVGVTAFMVSREGELGRPQKQRFAAFGLFALGAIIAGWVSYATVYAPEPIAEADLDPKSGTQLDFAVPDGRVQIVAHGEMGDPHSRNAGTGRYTVEVKEGDKFLVAFDGTLDQHSETRRVMKRGITNIEIKHLEGRHDLTADYAGKALTLRVTKEEGNLKGPMHVMVIHAPPPELAILLAGFILSLAGAVLDRKMKLGSKSYVGVGVAFYAAFALLVLESAHPLEVPHLAAVVPMSLLLGAAAGGLCRALVKPFVKPPPGAVPSSDNAPKAAPKKAPAKQG